VAQKIRIRLKAYDHRVLDQAAEKIVETASPYERAHSGPNPTPDGDLKAHRHPFAFHR